MLAVLTFHIIDAADKMCAPSSWLWTVCVLQMI